MSYLTAIHLWIQRKKCFSSCKRKNPMFVTAGMEIIRRCTFLAVDRLDAGGVTVNDSSDFVSVTCELLLDGT